MCKWGTVRRMHLYNSETGVAREWPVDECIADIVEALQASQITMIDSCCAHGKGRGEIRLADGRTLWVEGAGQLETCPQCGQDKLRPLREAGWRRCPKCFFESDDSP